MGEGASGKTCGLPRALQPLGEPGWLLWEHLQLQREIRALFLSALPPLPSRSLSPLSTPISCSCPPPLLVPVASQYTRPNKHAVPRGQDLWKKSERSSQAPPQGT